MIKFLLGLEIEYAIGGSRLREDILEDFMDLVRKTFRYLPGKSHWDLFIENGCRFYVDSGGHPELCTPECTELADVVRYMLAAEKVLGNIIDEMLVNERAGDFLALYRCNVDYSGSNSTWGCHESYLHRTAPTRFPAQLISHLVTRIIYTGAGGFNPFHGGIDFTLSPRVWHLQHVISGESTHDRGIFHTKNETLSKSGTNRLHLICGESLCSHIATWLRLGTTALIVRMIDGGLKPGSNVELKYPIKALRTLTQDPTCRVPLDLADGRKMSAIDIQRHYLNAAKRALKRRFMPSWAKEVCEQWESMLDRIETGVDSISTTLDWGMKYAIYRDHCKKRGIQWEDMKAWNHITCTIKDALKKSKHEGKASVELVLGQEQKPNPIPETIKELTPYLEEHLLSWDMLRTFVDLRKELFELEIRFGQLGQHGLFNKLDRAGVLKHHAPGVDNIDEAITVPPAEGRAHLRGETIKSLAGTKGTLCTWNAVYDLNNKRELNLSNPFETKAVWKEITQKDILDSPLRRLRERMADPSLFPDLPRRRESR